MDAGNALELRVRTHQSVGAKTSIEASLTSLNGHSVAGSLSQPGTRTRTEQALYYYFPQMAQGFTVEGTVSLTFPQKPRGGSRVQFTVRAGTIPCSSTGNAPTVSVTSPAANSAFSAPATVTVMAAAQDSDGTVAQVAFFANGTPIGAATSSPFTVHWANVQAGAYSLTAVATDNDGLQTTSAAVPITVGTGQALYFIHVDHLNTPRLVADSMQKTVWRWDQQEPFGNNPADEDPDGDGIAFSLPQRFPGQYYDAETLLHYNYFREYDAGIGRYVESDPIGLRGGPSTYAYVLASPIGFVDVVGLVRCRFVHVFDDPASIISASPGDPITFPWPAFNSTVFVTCALGPSSPTQRTPVPQSPMSFVVTSMACIVPAVINSGTMIVQDVTEYHERLVQSYRIEEWCEDGGCPPRERLSGIVGGGLLNLTAPRLVHSVRHWPPRVVKSQRQGLGLN